MMLSVRFQAEDIKVTNRIARRLKQKNRLVENTLSIPLQFVAQSKPCIYRAVQLASRWKLDRQGLATVAQVAMVAGFTSAALNVVRSVALLRFSVHVDMALESAMLARVLALPIKFFRQFTSGNLTARMQGLSRIQNFLAGETVGIVFNFAFGFWSLGLMCYYSMKLTGVALLIWIIYSLISFFIMSRLINFNRKQTTAYNDTAGILQQIFTGLTKFCVFGF